MKKELFCYETERKVLESKGWVKEVIAEYGPVRDTDTEEEQVMSLLSIECPDTDDDIVYDILKIPRFEG